ncbi:SRPBCC family protein [Nitratireductor mangrovi]|nr:SRPBCC domain-containing protein [Nitratireductor mangrovi]
MTTADMVSLTVRRRFAASAERVFDAFLDTAMARMWMFTTPDTAISRCEIDARVGGRFTMIDHRPDGDIEHVGEYLVIDRPRRLVFTFAVPSLSPDYDRVEVDITPDGNGCVLTLTNVMTPEVHAEWGDKVREGWTMMIGTLTNLLDAEQEAPAGKP